MRDTADGQQAQLTGMNEDTQCMNENSGTVRCMTMKTQTVVMHCDSGHALQKWGANG